MPLNKGYLTAKQTPASDECLTPFYAVDPLLEFLTDNPKLFGVHLTKNIPHLFKSSRGGA